MTAKDHLFNAIHPALEDVGMWAPLADRLRIADSIHTYLRQHNIALIDTAHLHALETRAGHSPQDQTGEAL